MLARVALAPFPPRLPVDAWKALGSWRPGETPDELVILCAFTVAGVTFPTFLAASPRETGRPRVAHAAFGAFEAEQEIVWSRGSRGSRGTAEARLSVGSWWAGVQRGGARLSRVAFGAHLAGQASLLIFISDGRARQAWWAGVSGLPPGSWLPEGSWESGLTSGTFGQRWMWGVGWRSWWAWVTPFSLEREKRETEGCETSPLEFWVLCLSLRTRVGSGLQAQCRLP